MAGPGENGHVLIPRWQLAVVGSLFLAFVSWAIADRVAVGRVLIDLRERVTRLETIHRMEGMP